MSRPSYHKYHAVKVKADGITFDSKSEYRRYVELRMLERAMKIRSLEVHKKFPLIVNGKSVGNYIADFVYEEVVTGAGGTERVIEDVKGVRTPVYNLKKKLMKACLGVNIREIDANPRRKTRKAAGASRKVGGVEPGTSSGAPAKIPGEAPGEAQGRFQGLLREPHSGDDRGGKKKV